MAEPRDREGSPPARGDHLPAASGPAGDAQRRPADWQLPQGVDRPLWEYLTSTSIARDYDEYFSGTNLLELDCEFLGRHFCRPGRLLDLGCGTGRVLAHFARRGLEVVGVDLSSPMLEVAAQKRDRLGLSIDLVCANICRLEAFEPERFDYACCMFSTLGMIVGADQRRRALAEVHRLLRPGGLFGLHLHNRWYNLTDPRGLRWLVRDLLGRLVRSPGAGDKVMPQYRGIPNLTLHIYSLSEIEGELSQAGFSFVEILPLAAGRRGKLAASGLFGSFRANGWLLMCRKR